MPIYFVLGEFISSTESTGQSDWAVDAATEAQAREMIVKAMADDRRHPTKLSIVGTFDHATKPASRLFDGVGTVIAIRESRRSDQLNPAKSGISLQTSRAKARTIDNAPWIAPALWRAFFSSANTKNSFLLVEDGKLQTAEGSIRESIASSGLQGVCLYDLDDDSNVKDCAPWLINLTCHDASREHPPTQLHKAVFGRSNGLEHGILLQSSASLEAMRKNLRRLTRVQDSDGKWYYCRFWEPEFFLYLALFLEKRRLLAPLSDLSAFAVLIEEELIVAEVNLSADVSLPVDRAGDLDLLFDAGTAMVALRRARALEREFGYGCRPQLVYALARERLSLRGMDYSFVTKCVDIAYAMRHFYLDVAAERLNDDTVTRCLDQHGNVQIFINYLHGLCMFALIHNIAPHKLRSDVRF